MDKVAPYLVVKSAVKSLMDGARMSGDFVEALNADVIELVEKAKKRAKDNGRGTVQPRDL